MPSTAKQKKYHSDRGRYAIARAVAGIVNKKQLSYGDSFGRSCAILAIFFPDGVPVEKYQDLLAITRVIDKLFRIANQKKAFGENPWLDIMGYALLSIERGMRND